MVSILPLLAIPVLVWWGFTKPKTITSSRQMMSSFLTQYAPELLAIESLENRDLASGLWNFKQKRELFQRIRIQSIAGSTSLFILLLALDLSILNVLLALLGSIFLFLGLRTYHRTNKARSSRNIVSAEFPHMMEELSVSVAAGLSFFNALTELVKNINSELLRESFEFVLNSINQGKGTYESISEWSTKYGFAEGYRLVDAFALHHFQGTPLASLLITQSQELRNKYRNQMLERCTKTEVAMAIPVVFLMLPVTVLFSLYPSFNQLVLLTQ